MKSIIFSSYSLTLTSPNLSHMDFLDDPAAIHGSRLIISCTTKDASSNEYMHPEIWTNNCPKTTHSFTGYLPAITPDTDISSCACIVLLSEASSSSHVILQHCASAQTPGPWDGHLALSSVLWAWNLSHFIMLTRPWSSLICLILIFWMTPLQSVEADW